MGETREQEQQGVNETQSRSKLIKQAREQDVDLHIGALHELRVEECNELEQGDAGWKLKGSLVFLVDRVNDAYGQADVVEELP